MQTIPKLPESPVQSRPGTDSNGRRIATTAAQLEAFWRRYASTKTVDIEGRPLALYHGTASDYAVFVIPPGSDEGIYCTPSTALASDFAINRALAPENSPVIIPLYALVENPLVMHDWDLAYWLDDDEGQRDWANMPRLIHNAKLLGHDGIHLREPVEHDGTNADQWIVFSADRVTSAIGNPGIYEPGQTHLTGGLELPIGVPIDLSRPHCLIPIEELEPIKRARLRP